MDRYGYGSSVGMDPALVTSRRQLKLEILLAPLNPDPLQYRRVDPGGLGGRVDHQAPYGGPLGRHGIEDPATDGEQSRLIRNDNVRNPRKTAPYGRGRPHLRLSTGLNEKRPAMRGQGFGRSSALRRAGAHRIRPSERHQPETTD
jgi:hypothetical protein